MQTPPPERDQGRRGPAPDGLIGATAGPYRLTRILGSGGMGTVYEARHRDLGQLAAVKVLTGPRAAGEADVARFMNEGRALGAVRHPGLVKIFDCATLPDGTPYLLMELLEGETLWTRLERLRGRGELLPVPEAVGIARQLGATLEAVHRQGILHRDLKPENVLLVPDPEARSGERTKLLDFGLAKFTVAQAGQRQNDHRGAARVATEGGMLLGTPAYMSPEQCSGGGQVGAAADVYALGVVLYEMLAGRTPFTEEEPGRMMAAHLLLPAPLLRRGLPAALRGLVAETLRKAPAERPGMAEVHARLTRIAAVADRDPVQGAPERVQPPGRVRAGLAVVAAAVSLLVLLGRGRPTEPGPQAQPRRSAPGTLGGKRPIPQAPPTVRLIRRGGPAGPRRAGGGPPTVVDECGGRCSGVEGSAALPLLPNIGPGFSLGVRP